MTFLSYSTETQCQCQVCKSRRGERSTLKHKHIESYSYEPYWEPRTAGKSDKFPYFLGVELETDRQGNRYDENGIRIPPANRALEGTLAADLGRPRDFWVPKSDSSVSGPEFCSMPATLPYWQKTKPRLTEMFSMLVHAGYRSHNGGRAGCHVNISKTAFSSPEHLHRFLMLIYTNQMWAVTLSQRTYEQASHWAPFRPYDLETAERMVNTSYAHTADKYSVVGDPDRARLEFRLPRGTLRIDRFYKNLEWAAAMVAFTRQADSTTDLSAGTFTDWLPGVGAAYPSLMGFLDEKSSEIRDAVRSDDSYRARRLADCMLRRSPLAEPYVEPYDEDDEDDEVYVPEEECQCEHCTRSREAEAESPSPWFVTTTPIFTIHEEV